MIGSTHSTRMSLPVTLQLRICVRQTPVGAGPGQQERGRRPPRPLSLPAPGHPVVHGHDAAVVGGGEQLVRSAARAAAAALAVLVPVRPVAVQAVPADHGELRLPRVPCDPEIEGIIQYSYILMSHVLIAFLLY